jgi:hypothetical protein
MRYALPWLGVAAVTALIYFRNFNSSLGAEYPNYAGQHPWASLKFFIFAAGDVVGVQPAGDLKSVGYPLIVLFGIVTLIISVALVIRLGVRRDSRTGTPIGIALIIIAALFDLMITKGRILFGYAAAGASRYTTFSLLFLCGIYLCLLGRHYVSDAWRATFTAEASEPAPTPTPTSLRRRLIAATAGTSVALLIVVQVGFGMFYGWTSASSFLVYQKNTLTIEQNAAHEPEDLVSRLYLEIHPASWVRKQIATLKEHRLNYFERDKTP